jgi:hypothetical protein
MILRLTPPVSRRDAMSRLDQVRELRFTEVAQLGAIKPPAVLLPNYTSLVAAIKAVGDDEIALASGTKATRRAALAARRRDARLARETALRLGLRGCASPAVPIPGIAR